MIKWGSTCKQICVYCMSCHVFPTQGSKVHMILFPEEYSSHLVGDYLWKPGPSPTSRWAIQRAEWASEVKKHLCPPEPPNNRSVIAGLGEPETGKLQRKFLSERGGWTLQQAQKIEFSESTCQNPAQQLLYFQFQAGDCLSFPSRCSKGQSGSPPPWSHHGPLQPLWSFWLAALTYRVPAIGSTDTSA